MASFLFISVLPETLPGEWWGDISRLPCLYPCCGTHLLCPGMPAPLILQSGDGGLHHTLRRGSSRGPRAHPKVGEVDLRAQPGVSREGHQGTMICRHHWEDSYSYVSCRPQQAPGDQESVATSGAFQKKLGSCERKERV